MPDTDTATVIGSITDIIEKVLGYSPDEYEMSDSLIDDLDADSLGFVEMAVEVKRTFGIEFNEESMTDVKTPQDIVDKVTAAL